MWEEVQVFFWEEHFKAKYLSSHLHWSPDPPQLPLPSHPQHWQLCPDHGCLAMTDVNQHGSTA